MDTNKFTTQILPLKDNLHRVVFRITDDAQLSELIVQEMMLKLWNEKDSWMVIQNLPAYCMLIARNMALQNKPTTLADNSYFAVG